MGLSRLGRGWLLIKLNIPAGFCHDFPAGNIVIPAGFRWHRPVIRNPVSNSLVHYPTFWNTIKHLGTLSNILEHNQISWNTMKHFGTLSNILEY